MRILPLPHMTYVVDMLTFASCLLTFIWVFASLMTWGTEYEIPLAVHALLGMLSGLVWGVLGAPQRVEVDPEENEAIKAAWQEIEDIERRSGLG